MDHVLRRFGVPAMLAVAAFAPGAWAQAPASAAVEWGCDAPMGRTCYFSILSPGGGAARSFSLPAGRRMRLGGFVVGRDEYLVSVDAPNLGDLNRCRQLIAMGHACQRKAVDTGYND